MKHVRKRIKQYVAFLLVVTMVFTQFVTSYAQGGGMNGIRQYETYHTYDTATASDGENKIPVTPDEDPDVNENTNQDHADADHEDKDEDEITLEDDRYDQATASDLPDASSSDAGKAGPRPVTRIASGTYLLRYQAIVDGSWQIIYEEEVCEGDDGVPPEVPEREGYTFAGWSRNNPYVNVRASRTVVATYVAGDVNMHAVNFTDENDRLVVNTEYVQDGKGATRPAVNLYKREGCTFLGWDQDFYNVTEDLDIGPRYMEGEHTVYWLSYWAKYEGVAKEIKYELVPKGGDGSPPEVPEREGYTFAGWVRQEVASS